MGRKALAYVVTEDTEGTGGVVFAKSNAQARREGASEFGDGDFNSYRARRAPEFDCFAENGSVPATVMIEHGWWFECAHCGVRVSQDANDYLEEDQEPMQPVDGEHCYEVFCTPACAEGHKAEQLMRVRLREYTLAWLQASLLAKMPGAQIIKSKSPFDNHVYARRHKDPDELKLVQGIIAFRFPGCKVAPAHYRFDTERKGKEQPHVTVCNGDKAAFEAWRDAGYPADFPTPAASPALRTGTNEGDPNEQ